MHWWEAAGLVAGVASLVIAIAALVVSLLAFRRSDRNASASTLIGLTEGLRQAWHRFLTAPADTREYEFADLCNLLEIGCVILADDGIHGRPRQVVDELLHAMLGHIDENPEATRLLDSLRERPTTFEYLLAYLRRRRERIALHH